MYLHVPARRSEQTGEAVWQGPSLGWVPWAMGTGRDHTQRM